MDTGGMRPLLLQHRTISFKLLAKSVNCLFARSPPCTKVCMKTSLSSYYALCFFIIQYNFHLLIYSQPSVIYHFTNWWHLLHFPWTTAFTRTFATSILWCYNFNGMIKWYDISWATLYLWSIWHVTYMEKKIALCRKWNQVQSVLKSCYFGWTE